VICQCAGIVGVHKNKQDYTYKRKRYLRSQVSVRDYGEG